MPEKPVRLVREAPAQRYRVKEGDCLWTISRVLLGKGRQWRSIYAANQGIIQNPDLIYPGQLLLIPTSARASAPDHPAPRASSRQATQPSKHSLRTTEGLRHYTAKQPPSRAVVSRKPDGGFDVSITPVDRREAPRMVRPPARQAPAKPLQPGVVGDQFQGHRRVDGHFYRIVQGQLVWADDKTPVRGEWSKRLAEQVYPSRQAPAAAPQPPAAPVPAARPPEPAAPEPASAEPTIQGHRRVNGTFFVRTEAGLVWADDGTPVRPDAQRTSAVAP
ncbi:LysM domain/BON superfamily protein [compost metagenome]